eukprot:1157031-Pelagomonas_calceolata.AAC.9
MQKSITRSESWHGANGELVSRRLVWHAKKDRQPARSALPRLFSRRGSHFMPKSDIKLSGKISN